MWLRLQAGLRELFQQPCAQEFLLNDTRIQNIWFDNSGLNSLSTGNFWRQFFVSAILQHFSFLIRLRLQQHPVRRGIDYFWNHFQVAGFTHSSKNSSSDSSESSASALGFLEIHWDRSFYHRRRTRHTRHWECQTRLQNRLRFVQIDINKLFWLYFENIWRSRLNNRLQWAALSAALSCRSEP